MLYIIIVLAGIAAAAVGTLGSIYGARIGAEKSIEVIIEMLDKQRLEEKTLKEKEKVERASYIQSILITFIAREIEENYKTLDLNGDKNLPIGTNFKLKFDEYERTKYKLLENPTKSVKEINKLYNMFYEIVDMNDNNQVQDKMKKMDQIIEQKDTIDILLSDLKYMKNVL